MAWEVTSAGGVVVRGRGDRLEVAVGEQRDRLTGRETLRLPKGRVDPGESLEQAALREVLEETGLEARILGPLETAHYAYQEEGQRVDKRVHYFLMEHLAGDPEPRDGEMSAVRWASIDRAQRDLTFEAERRAVEGARRQLG